MPPTTTLTTLLLDETGSMQSIREPTIKAHNDHLDHLAKLNEEGHTDVSILATLIKFDSNHITTVYDDQPPALAPRLNLDTYTPGAMTPLIDACVHAINTTVERRNRLLAANPLTTVRCAVTIQTDGQENCSRQHTHQHLADLVKKYTAEGWLFTFLGAGIDSFAVANKMGIDPGGVLDYGRNKSAEAFSAASNRVRSYAGSGQSVSFSDEDRQRSKSGG